MRRATTASVPKTTPPEGHTARPRIVPGPETQRLWFHLSAGSHWRSLALVPSGKEVDVGPLACDLARLAAASAAANSGRVLLIDARRGGQSLRAAAGNELTVIEPGKGTDDEFFYDFLPTIDMVMSSGHADHTSVIVAADAPVVEFRMIPLVRAVNLWVMAVRLGETKIPAAREAIELIGRKNLLGSVIVQEPDEV